METLHDFVFIYCKIIIKIYRDLQKKLFIISQHEKPLHTLKIKINIQILDPNGIIITHDIVMAISEWKLHIQDRTTMLYYFATLLRKSLFAFVEGNTKRSVILKSWRRRKEVNHHFTLHAVLLTDCPVKGQLFEELTRK